MMSLVGVRTEWVNVFNILTSRSSIVYHNSCIFYAGEEDEEMGEVKQEPEYSYPKKEDGHNDEEEEEMEGEGDKEESVWVKFEDEEYQKTLKQGSPAPSNKIHR